jgi:hypothetical protein
MTSDKSLSEGNDPKLSALFRNVILSITGTYTLAAIFYADPFHFWQHALSELGTTRTLLGTPNWLGAVLFAFGMLITGRLLLMIAVHYQTHPTLSNHKVKSWFLYLASIGAFIAIFPNNKFHTIHSIGSSMMIGPIFLLEMTLLWEEKDLIGSWKCLWITLLLSSAVLTYALAFFINTPIKQSSQKICVIAMLLVLLRNTGLKVYLEEKILTQLRV